MCEQDEAWSTSRYFSEARMRELYDEKGPGTSRTGPNRAALEEKARRMIASSLELADRVEATYDGKWIPGLWQWQPRVEASATPTFPTLPSFSF